VLEAHAEHNKIDVVSSLLVAVAVIFARKACIGGILSIAIFECLHVMHGSGIILGRASKALWIRGMSEDTREDQRPHLEVGGY